MARTQEMTNQAVVPDRIDPDGLDCNDAWNHVIARAAVMIVQKRMDQRQPYSKVSDSQESEPTTGANMYRSLWHIYNHTAVQWYFSIQPCLLNSSNEGR